MIYLENKIFNEVKKGNNKAIENALLIVSGLEGNKVYSYKRKLDEIEFQFDRYQEKHGKPVNHRGLAAQLCDFINERKALHYERDTRLLTQAIDGSLGGTQTRIGNCLALSELYAVLGVRKSLELSCEATHDHIWLNLEYEKKYIPIDLARSIDARSSSQKIRARGDKGVKLPLGYLVSAALEDLATDIRDNIASLKIAERAVDICLNSPFSYINLALCKGDTGDLFGALEDCNKAISIGHESPYLYIARANVQAELKNYPAALIDFEKALKLDQNYEDVYYWRGKMYYNIGNFNAASTDFARYFSFLSNYSKYEKIEEKSECLINLGISFAQLGKIESALVALDAALKINPENELAPEWKEKLLKNN